MLGTDRIEESVPGLARIRREYAVAFFIFKPAGDLSVCTEIREDVLLGASVL